MQSFLNCLPKNGSHLYVRNKTQGEHKSSCKSDKDTLTSSVDFDRKIAYNTEIIMYGQIIYELKQKIALKSILIFRVSLLNSKQLW